MKIFSLKSFIKTLDNHLTLWYNISINKGYSLNE